MSKPKPQKEPSRLALPASIVTVIFAGILVLILNYFSLKYFETFDLTTTGDFTLSDRTENFLSSLDEPIKISVFGAPAPNVDIYLRRLLSLYERASDGGLTYQFVDPDLEFDRQKALALVEEFDLMVPEDLLLIQAGDRQAVLRVDELYEMSEPDFMSGTPERVTAWLGEEEISAKLIELLSDEKSIAYFLEGHGEGDWRDRDSERGWGEAAARVEREFFEVRGLSLVLKSDVPEDADILIIAGPRNPLLPTEIEALDRYLARGGRLLVALDWDRRSGLAELLSSRGILVRDEKLLGGISQIVGGMEMRQFGSNVPLLQQDFTNHPILQSLRLEMIMMPNLRALQVTDSTLAGWQAAELLRAPEAFWGETGEWNEETDFDEGLDLPGPVPIAAIAEGPNTARIAVFGGAFPFDNKNIVTQPGVSDLWSNTINWLTQRESLLGIGPKQARDYRLTLDTTQTISLFVIVVLLLPGAVLAWGIIVWIQRRG